LERDRAQPSLALALANYYEALVGADVPGPLAHEVVLDAARRLHAGDMQAHFELGDLR
jgi:hypothetical protein